MPSRKLAVDFVSGGARVLSSLGGVLPDLPQVASHAAKSGVHGASGAATFVVRNLNPWNLVANVSKLRKMVEEGASKVDMQEVAQSVASKGAKVGHGMSSQFTHSGVEVANDIFAALGLRLWIAVPAARSATAQVRVVDVAPSAAADALKEAIGPRQLVQFMREMQSDRSNDVACLVDSMIEEKRLKNLWFLAPSFQRKLYIDLAQVLIFGVKRSLLMLNDTTVWGHKVKVSAHQSLDVEAIASRRPTSSVGEDQLRLVVDSLIASQVVHLRGVPKAMERQIYHNCVVVVVQLIATLLTSEGQQIELMGHALRFRLEPQPLNVVRNIMSEEAIKRGEVDEDALAQLVEEFIQNPETNIAWVPDFMERQVYQGVFRLMIRVAEDLLCRLRLNVLGRELKLSLVSASVRERASEAYADADLFLEEHQPLRTLSTTALQERLKDLDEQRRILEALQRLHGADFDLTAEVPMKLLDGEHGEVLHPLDAREAPADTKTASGFASSPGTSSSESSAVHSEYPSKNFDQLALTRKLARTLSLSCEVPTEIDIPYDIIGDVETYPLWMPWCTSGKVLGEAPSLPASQTFCAGADDGAVVSKTDVGFGFETGTFLGTIEDLISYRLSKQAPARAVPAQDASGSVAESTQPHASGNPVGGGRVIADAITGFSYAERLVYDWRFSYINERRTLVELDMFFQARSVLHLPVWDSMQRMIVDNMLSAFVERAVKLQRQRDAARRSQMQERLPPVPPPEP